MSAYTTQLRWIIESGITDIGLNDYPIFDESYRAGLNKKIIEHYYFREIGLETFGLFKRFLSRKMNEIMPYYNQLYESEQIQYDPLKTYDLTETSSSSSKSLYNDTPMGKLNDPYSESYATDTTVTSQDNSHTLSGKNDSKSYATLINEYRQVMINIDMQVIDELETLFMKVWDS